MILTGVLALAGLGGAPTLAADVQPRRHTLFLDFGGGPLGPGDGVGEATCVTSSFLYPIFLGSGRAAELALVEAQRVMAPYGVRVVGERPPSPLPFTHVRVGGEPLTLGLDEKLNGLSCEVDCDDGARLDTVFVFADKWIDRASLDEQDEDLLALQVGRIAVHEAAHAWGLEHTGGSESIMARFPSAAVPSFVQGCQALDLDHDTQCAESRTRHCPGGEQDAHAELLALFGDGSPDLSPPHAEIVWPPDGHALRPGDVLMVEVEVSDDHHSLGWSLEVPELQWRHESTEPGAHALELAIPEGTWTLRLEAIDHDRNVAEARAVITAEAIAEPPEGASESVARCACRSDGRPPWSGWALLLVLARRRRRRRAGTSSRVGG